MDWDMINTIFAILTVVLGGFVKVLWDKLDDNKKDISNLYERIRESEMQIKNLEITLKDEINHKNDTLSKECSAKRDSLWKEVMSQKEKTHDLEVSITGFSGVYVTRTDCEKEHRK